ncbi:unnamed protein product [Lathyrus oleraceus]
MFSSYFTSIVSKWTSFTHFNFIFFFFFLLFLTCQYDAVSPFSDKSTLLRLKNSLSDPAGVLSTWNPSSGHCSWYGVRCDSGLRVVSLNITGNGDDGHRSSHPCSDFGMFPLYGFGIRRSCVGVKGSLLGKFPSLISELTELRVLSLPFNGLEGSIPEEIWSMEKLEVLDLEGNLISGYLPLHIQGLKNLRVLNLGFNKIVGVVPSVLSSLDSLEVLNLAANGLNGSVPGFVGKLKGVYLSFNQFSGVIPGEIGKNCGKLEHLDLSGNSLVQEIPKSLGNCGLLKTLLLYSNLLEEEIPAEFGNLKSLVVLDVSRNTLSGSIPRELGNCKELTVVVLSNLFNPIGDVEFVTLNDELNYFEGSMPEEVVSLPKLTILWAPMVNLEGSFPRNWGACGNLEMVSLAQNFFTGEFPNRLGLCKKLHFLDLSLNNLTGELSKELHVPCMTVFDVSGNMLSGSVPDFSNNVCSPFPSWNGNLFESDNAASPYASYFISKARERTLFASLGGVGLSVFHNLGQNNFSGIQSLPIAGDRMEEKSGYTLLVDQNEFTGPFPTYLLKKCEGLDGLLLNLSFNRLSGEIPSNISRMCKSLKVLDASGNRISGEIPYTVGDSVSLVSLNLSKNQLQGQIPASLGQMKDLKFLSLAGNNLSGSIPSNLGQLYSLQVLDLSTNSLTGEIPKFIENMRNLTDVLLNNNNLSGHIPAGLANVTTLSILNVSFNNLSGYLPSNSSLIKCSSAVGNPFLSSCRGVSLTVPSANQQGQFEDNSSITAQSTGKSSDNGFSAIEIASITSASAIVSVLIALIVLFFFTRRWKPNSRVGGSAKREVTVFTDIGVPLTFENVVQATGNFNASNCIGSGGFGATYKAEISQGILVAVKRLSVGRFQGVQQFHAEIKTLGRLHHPNLVTLIGYHACETEMFLIYNYLPGGNLEKFIQERSTRAVDWKILHKIALDIARALSYLHDQCVPRVLHRDVKPSNILLDDDFNAYLSDFGLARLLGTSETHATTGVAGTFGYVAPEYAMTCRVSDKADVYSYGVVLLELLSDKKALDPSFSSYGNGFNIVAWGCMLLREGRAKEFFTPGLWDAGPENDLVEVLHLAVVCTVDSLSTRPTMKQVVKRLKQLQPPPC